MNQIIKFCEITLRRVKALDEVLASDAVRTSKRCCWKEKRPGGVVLDTWSWPPFAKKLRVKGDGNGFYLYEITISSELRVYLDGHVIVKCPRRVLNAIYDAVGLYPAEEMVIPDPDGSRRATRTWM